MFFKEGRTLCRKLREKKHQFYGLRSFLFFLNLEVSSPVAASLGDGAKFGLWMGNVSQKCFASYISVASDGFETFLHLCAAHFL